MVAPGEDSGHDVAELRRRADELAVLNDLARRLAALHDTREVLDEVARQARRLLGGDVAYIMLLRDGRLRIEVVDGAMGSAMRGIELEAGQGLGGQVLATGRPLWSESYLADTRFPHADGTDSAARSEQLGGILGVPLVVGDDTLGVLLAAERRPRAFVDHDVELLAGLAAHAALALRTADLFDRERAAAAELRTANATLREVSERRQRASDLRDVLNDVVIRGGGLPAVVTALDRSAGLAVEVRDDDGRTLAGDRIADGWPRRPRATCPGARAGAPSSRPPPPSPTRRPSACCASGPRRSRCCWPRSARWPRPSSAPAGSSSHALLSSERRRGQPAAPGPRHRHRPARRHRRWPSSTPNRSAPALPRPSPPASAPSCGGGRPPTPARSSCSSRPAWRTRARSSSRLSGPDGVAPTTGLAAGAGGPAGVRSAHEEARQTAALLLALDRAGTCAASDDLGLYRSLFSRSGRAGLATFIRSTVGPLLDHDRERQRDLAATLETYLEQARHHARTCDVLHIHANTLYQRLDRITEVLGPQWKEPGRALELQVALRLHRLLAARPD